MFPIIRFRVVFFNAGDRKGRRGGRVERGTAASSLTLKKKWASLLLIVIYPGML